MKLLLWLAFTTAAAAGTIPNPLGLHWPWELVHCPTNLTGPLSVKIGDEIRPAQSDGSNVWFIVTHKGPQPLHFTILQTNTPSPLTLLDNVVANGVYEYRLPFGQFRAAGDSEWSGQWESTLPVTTEILERGPVFIKARLRSGTSYEATLRFVVGDPWIDITERYDLPGPVTYRLTLKDGLRPDHVFWTPWFGHEGFRPIGTQQRHPLQPQAAQGTRPFVMLRPRWNQQPGSGQDFFVSRNESNAPAVGVIATFPTRWVNPYNQTIHAFAENGDTARIEFPTHTGARSYALVIGRREQLDGQLDSLVRRHTDWTLDKQWHETILEWPRNPALAGPHILLTRAELAKLQADYQAGKISIPDNLKGPDQELANLVMGKPGKPSLPGAHLWLERRYQNDFLNPTSHTRAIKKGLPLADMLANGQPFGGPAQAALGYIFTDLEHWPGWHNGWSPGNPNFHTDKYMVAAFVGAALLDHPHAGQWLAFAKENFDDDLKRVFFEPDGVGYECPGYAGYSMGLQLEVARVFQNIGSGNFVASNPLWKKNMIWHRHLLTPVDCRLGFRHEAPIGDTHRWTAGGLDKAGAIAKFYREKDPAFASEMMAMRQLLHDQGQPGSFFENVLYTDHSIPATPLDQLDWGSHAFHGFGAVMRHGFGTPRETFVSFKAGPARGHYHNDELSYHYYGAGTPLSLDYNCSYGPRGDHAALHNSMTFGKAATVEGVPGQEQIFGAANVVAFHTTPAFDLVVAERTSDRLTLSPVDPDQSRFGFHYPSRPVSPITHRRYLMLVKPAGYLVVRDETLSTEPQQLNIHLLARDAKRDGPVVRAAGQWDTDALVYFARAAETGFEVRRWFYYADKKPAKDPEGLNLIPPVGHTGTWMAGEYQKWLRLETQPGTPILWVLFPKKQGDPEPKFADDGRALRVGNDEIVLTSTEARVNGTTIALRLPALGDGSGRPKPRE